MAKRVQRASHSSILSKHRTDIWDKSQRMDSSLSGILNSNSFYLCEVRITARPSLSTLTIQSHRRRRDWGSIPVVGSSCKGTVKTIRAREADKKDKNLFRIKSLCVWALAYSCFPTEICALRKHMHFKNYTRKQEIMSFLAQSSEETRNCRWEYNATGKLQGRERSDHYDQGSTQSRVLNIKKCKE